jgi:hypothetical protein
MSDLQNFLKSIGIDSPKLFELGRNGIIYKPTIFNTRLNFCFLDGVELGAYTYVELNTSISNAIIGSYCIPPVVRVNTNREAAC